MRLSKYMGFYNISREQSSRTYQSQELSASEFPDAHKG